MINTLQQKITETLLQAGFIEVGFSKAGPVDQSWADKLQHWLSEGHNNGLQYMERNNDKRIDTTLFRPGSKSVISMLHPWPEMNFDDGKLKIAGYAHGHDYHLYLPKIAEPALALLSAADHASKPVFLTDSAAMFDRYWAWKAGLGFIGRNGFIIHREAGSRVLIAHILTSIEFDYTATPLENACGHCTNCYEHCPTQAFNRNGTIDARKCIACFNIESKKQMPEEMAEKNPGWIFGCDICQLVCPYNQTKTLFEGSAKMKDNWNVPATVDEWLNLNETEFAEKYAHTPLKRAGIEKIKQTIKDLFPDTSGNSSRIL